MTDTKKAPLLTIQKATSQARRHVDRLMPGVLATVDSRLSHDLETDTPLVVTTVTFPRGHAARHLLGAALTAMPNRFAPLAVGDSSIRVTRTR